MPRLNVPFKDAHSVLMFPRQGNNQIVVNRQDSLHETSSWHRLNLIPEVWGLIFIFCLPSYNIIPSEDVAPLLLTRVCRYWRSIALTTPKLWSGLRLKIPRKHVDEAELISMLRRFSSMLSNYLSRSGSVDISLDVDLSSPFNESWTHSDVRVEHHMTDLVSGFLPFSQQWRHLFLAAPFQHLLPVMSLIERGLAPYLDSLTLDFSCERTLTTSSGGGDALGTFAAVLDVSRSKRLSSLTIYGNAVDSVVIYWRIGEAPVSLQRIMLWNILLKVIPGSNSKKFHTNSLCKLSLAALIWTDDLLHVLETSPNLQDLTLDIQLIRPQQVWNDSNHIVQLDKLRRFRFSADESTSRLLDILYVPSLAFLEFACRDVMETGSVFLRFMRFLQLSEPRLVFFMFSDLSGVIRERELTSLLEQITTVEELRIIRPGLTDTILRALTMMHECTLNEEEPLDETVTDPDSSHTDTIRYATSVCPRLVDISLTEQGRFTSHAVIDLLLSRCLTDDQRSKFRVRDHSATIGSSPAVSEVQGQSCKSDSKTHIVRNQLSSTATLRLLQCTLERPDLVTEHPQIKLCMGQGLKLTL